MSLIFDSHAHYDDKAFDEDRNALLDILPQKGVCGVINCSSDLDNVKASISLAKKYNYIWAAIGVHPQEAANLPSDYIEQLKKFFLENNFEADKRCVVAIGEIGLDYYYDEPERDVQIKVFKEQLQLAKDLDLPVIVHDRDAHADTLEILREYKPKGVVHCFSGSLELAHEFINLGMNIGLGGVVTFKNAKHAVKVASEIPLDKLLIETDAPYMAPTPFRGKRCDSLHINLTADKIAELRGISKEEVLRATKENAMRVFGLQIS